MTIRKVSFLTPISGCGAKGSACFLVETRAARLLLDLGYGPQPGLWPDVSKLGDIDAVLLIHSHRDHAGALKLLPQIGNPRVYATDIVRRPAFGDARHLDAWQSAFGRARVALHGPVAL